jgi:hypothetical protein
VVAVLIPAGVEVLAGIIVVWTAVRMWQGRLTRGSVAGVRTASTMRSDEAFAVANKAAAPLTAAGGIIFAACGVLAVSVPRHVSGPFIFGGAGAFLIFCLLGAAVGVRAARPPQ